VANCARACVTINCFLRVVNVLEYVPYARSFRSQKRSSAYACDVNLYDKREIRMHEYIIRSVHQAPTFSLMLHRRLESSTNKLFPVLQFNRKYTFHFENRTTI